MLMLVVRQPVAAGASIMTPRRRVVQGVGVEGSRPSTASTEIPGSSAYSENSHQALLRVLRRVGLSDGRRLQRDLLGDGLPIQLLQGLLKSAGAGGRIEERRRQLPFRNPLHAFLWQAVDAEEFDGV